MTCAGITVVINTLNEERNISKAIRSVSTWANDVLVVDMQSDDRTAEVAAEEGARLLVVPRQSHVEPARRAGVEAAHGPWILVLDADEMVPKSLAEQLQTIATSDAADAVELSHLNYLLGRRILGSGWGLASDRHIRFFKRTSVEALPDGIHQAITLTSGARILQLPAEPQLAIVHFNYLDSHHFLVKLNRYTDVEAQQLVAAGEPLTWSKCLRGAVREVAWRLVKCRGYRDGWRGFVLAWYMATYRISAWAKAKQIIEAGYAVAASDYYNDAANQVLAEYRSGDYEPQ